MGRSPFGLLFSLTSDLFAKPPKCSYGHHWRRRYYITVLCCFYKPAELAQSFTVCFVRPIPSSVLLSPTFAFFRPGSLLSCLAALYRVQLFQSAIVPPLLFFEIDSGSTSSNGCSQNTATVPARLPQSTLSPALNQRAPAWTI